MLDMHSHILPGLDDGAPDMETALEMARMAVAAGIKTVVATPHYMKGTVENSADVVRRSTAEFQQALDSEGIALKIMPGAEVYLDLETPGLLKKGELMTVNDKGKYLLVEMPMGEIPRYTEEVLFELNVQGVTPVIAHPERNLAVISKPELIVEFVEKGCLLQVNTGSIMGYYGRKVRKTAQLLVRKGLIHVVGSDMHSPGECCRTMKRALQSIEELKHGKLEEILENSIAIVNGEEVRVRQPANIRGAKPNLWRKLVGMMGR